MSRTLTRRASAQPQAGPSYEADAYSWAFRQAQLLREGRFHEADIANIAEEIESLGRSERSTLRSFAARAIQHMLKWDYQPEWRTRSWRTSIEIHRVHARQQLAENPGLKSQLPAIVAEAYELGIAFAMDGTDLERTAFPARCPYDWDE
ncbi:MAG: DUF29 domain-containing protein, partial [Microvirga sp.]